MRRGLWLSGYKKSGMGGSGEGITSSCRLCAAWAFFRSRLVLVSFPEQYVDVSNLT